MEYKMQSCPKTTFWTQIPEHPLLQGKGSSHLVSSPFTILTREDPLSAPRPVGACDTLIA